MWFLNKNKENKGLAAKMRGLARSEQAQQKFRAAQLALDASIEKEYQEALNVIERAASSGETFATIRLHLHVEEVIRKLENEGFVVRESFSYVNLIEVWW